MIPYQYTYLTAVLISLILWIILFIHRKDLRREMLVMSIIVSIFGLFAEYFWWSKDWWHPQTVTGTIIGIEDILNGFVTGGISAVLYEEIFKKRVYKSKSKPHNLGALALASMIFIISAYFFHLLKFNSFLSSTIALIIAGVLLIIQRRDLLKDAILTGICLVIGLLPFYLILEIISPNYINNIWSSDLSGIKILHGPIEDIIFYFFFGFFIGPFYLYWKGERLIKRGKTNF